MPGAPRREPTLVLPLGADSWYEDGARGGRNLFSTGARPGESKGVHSNNAQRTRFSERAVELCAQCCSSNGVSGANSPQARWSNPRECSAEKVRVRNQPCWKAPAAK